MSRTVVTILHISDLHLSEDLGLSPSQLQVPHRYGHDPKILLALDQFLQDKSTWDVMVISGDLTRVGSAASFSLVRNWLDSRIYNGKQTIGLDLHDHRDRYVVVPGNHDRFNGRLTQRSLEGYSSQFGVIEPGQVQTTTVDGLKVNFHLFDSTLDGGGFAYGEINPVELSARKMTSNGELNIAVLHHHFIQPPEHPREPATELLNADEVAAYFMSAPFDAVFFGHTHRGYFDHPPRRLIQSLLPDPRRRGNLMKRILPRYILAFLDDGGAVAFRREPTKDGKLPSLERYYEYLYLKRKKVSGIQGPGSFRNVKKFYEHLDQFLAAQELHSDLQAIKRERVLLSMAPSACQAEASEKGLHRFQFVFENLQLQEIISETYIFQGATFDKVDGRSTVYRRQH